MFPDPVKPSISSGGTATVPIQRKSTPSLFGDDPLRPEKRGDIDLDADMDVDDAMPEFDDDFIIDDLEPEVKNSAREGFVKEMGKHAF